MSLNEFTHESLQDAESIATYLKALQDGFARGRIELTEGDATLIMEPSGHLDMTIRANKESGKCQVALTVSWSAASAEDANAAPLTINSGS